MNTSIRPGWFYHPEEDDKVRPLEELLGIYYGSVGGNATFLLNLPPDRRGLLHDNDRMRLRELGDAVRRTFRDNLAAHASAVASETGNGHAVSHLFDGRRDTYWSPEEGTERATIDLDLGEELAFDHIVLQEHRYSQRVERFELAFKEGSEWKPFFTGTVIGRKRICRFPAVKARSVRLTILESRWCPEIAAFEVYASPECVVFPEKG